MIRNLARFFLSNPHITSYLRRIYREANTGVASIETVVAEAIPIQSRATTFSKPRLNLLVPSIATKNLFGGINTALDLLKEISTSFEDVRIILTDEDDFRYEENPHFQDWGISSLGADDAPGRWIIPAKNHRHKHTLPVGLKDKFIATAWWTAISARSIQMWQMQEFNLPSPRKFIYLIQDFEPGFYPWSSRYALAESTYHYSNDVVAIFNSTLLKGFFDDGGYSFPNSYFFEPQMNRRLLAMRSSAMMQAREQRVLVYGRPKTMRNAFEVIVMALNIWISQNPNNTWVFVSAGEPHEPVDLGQGKTLVSLGKLSLDEYAMELGRCRIGISLMISPHPSYPPLEMAAFGMQVITNKYRNKNLSVLSDNIFSLESVSPNEMALLLDELTQTKQVANDFLLTKNTQWWEHYLGDKDVFREMHQSIARQMLED